MYQLGHYREALVSLDRALELDPSAYNALNTKGITHETWRLHASNYNIQCSDSCKPIPIRPHAFDKALTLDNMGLRDHDIGDINLALQSVSINSDGSKDFIIG